ncbi:MAG: hypothetical protein HY907_16725 [Deltaproteobacteria bacterium]|nr:hypothetical protein [Deltaproteobacteria bacterium]
MSERAKTPVPIELPAFDPNPSAAHEPTKDVDFAVPVGAIEPIKAALVRRGIVARPLSSGGLAVREGDIRVGFIDRREGGPAELFEEAIADAGRRGLLAAAGAGGVPVVAADYLVALKVVTGEDKDETDVVKLLRRLPAIGLSRTRGIILRHGGTGSAKRLDALARRAGRPDARPEYRSGGE